MGFLLRCLFVIALVVFVAVKSESRGPRSWAPARTVVAKPAPLEALREQTSAKLGEAARRRCLADPEDCLDLLLATRRRRD